MPGCVRRPGYTCLAISRLRLLTTLLWSAVRNNSLGLNSAVIRRHGIDEFCRHLDEASCVHVSE